ncbi:MAG: hypothetical protein ABWY65_05320 [Thermoleophilaceae bacterium]
MLESWSCAGTLAPTTRRVLMMRAGVFGRTPASRRTIARRLGITLTRTVRAERGGIRQLARAGTCIDAGGAALGTNVILAGGGGAATGSIRFGPLGGPDRLFPDGFGRQGVLGVSKSHIAPPPIGKGEQGYGWRDTLLAFLAVLLALALVTALAIGGRQLLPVAVAARPSRKPLLFLDIDGVIALRPDSGSLPPSGWEQIGSTNTYVSAQAGAFVRILGESFDLVWASDWEDLPSVTFDEAADDPKTSDWKVKRIEEMAGDRPLAWVDGTSDPAHRRWVDNRQAPTFIVQPEPTTRLAEDDVAALLVFAESVSDYDAGAGGAAGRSRRPRAVARS